VPAEPASFTTPAPTVAAPAGAAVHSGNAAATSAADAAVAPESLAHLCQVDRFRSVIAALIRNVGS